MESTTLAPTDVLAATDASAAAAASEGPPVLRLRHITKSFGQTRVLDGVSLDIRDGEFLTLLGPSGCGKTTLLRIIAGLEVPDAGEVLLDGRDIARVPASRRSVNTVFQNYALFPHLNVADNVSFGLRSRKVDEREVSRRVGDALGMMQLTELAKRYAHQLSGGQKQRVALARALVNEPSVLLLDEPMSALDAKLRAQVQVELRRLQQRLGKTFVLVTHDQDEAMTVSDRIAVMAYGRIEQLGSPHQVYESPRTRFVAEFLGTANLIRATKNGHWHRQALDTPLGVLMVEGEPEWTTGTLAIRPERVRICDAAPEVNGVEVTVRESVYRGDHQDVWADSAADGGATQLRLRTGPGVRVTRDQRLWLQLPPEDLEVLAD